MHHLSLIWCRQFSAAQEVSVFSQNLFRHQVSATVRLQGSRPTAKRPPFYDLCREVDRLGYGDWKLQAYTPTGTPSLRGKVSVMAGLMVEESDRGGLKRRKYRPFKYDVHDPEDARLVLRVSTDGRETWMVRCGSLIALASPTRRSPMSVPG